MQKQALGSINKILHRNRFNVLTTIYHQHQTALDAKQYLMAFDIPYFQHVSVAFFDGKKLLLSTEIPELLAKFRELNDDLIALLNTHDYFADVKILTFEESVEGTIWLLPHNIVLNKKLSIIKKCKIHFYSITYLTDSDHHTPFKTI